jgi:VIT1/CCC1 family predicted Fe2+/Mn2+ transporter
LGAAVPLAVAALAPPQYLLIATVVASLLCLPCLGGLAAKVGGASVLTGAMRVTFWSALAMAVTASVGTLISALS